MKLHFSVTNIAIELPLCRHRDAKERYCDNYLCGTIPLFNDPCPLAFSKPMPKPFTQAHYLI